MRSWMTTRSLILTLTVLGSALALPAQRFEEHWYQPHLLSSAAAATDRIQGLSSHFVPVSMEGVTFYLEEGYTLVRAEASASGLQLGFRKGRATHVAQTPWSAEAQATPSDSLGKDPLFTTVVYREINYLELWKVPAHHGHRAWCVAPVENLAGRNAVLCLSSVEEAQSLANALATLAQASGSTLASPLGMWAEPGITDDRRHRVKQSGWRVSRVDPEGPPATAGLQPGDLIYEVNHLPFPGSGSFFSAFRAAAWPGASSGDVRVVFFRGASTLSVVLHYPAAAQ